MNNILIVDGCSLSATSFYGTVPKEYFKIDKNDMNEVNNVMKDIPKSSTGVYLNAVYLFFNILGKAIRHKNFKRVIITWDIGRDTFRRDIYPDYKRNRKEKDILLQKQEDLIKELLQAANIYSIEDANYEADDLIGSFTDYFKNHYNIYIMSKDKDLLQLLDNNVYVWLKTNKSFDMYRERNKNYQLSLNNYYEYNQDDLLFFHNIESPEYIKDIKGILGDQGDNIPGVKGIGEKTAIPLINHFKTLEDLYYFIENNTKNNCESLFKKIGINRSPYTLLSKNKDIAFISKKLGEIKTDINYIREVKDQDITLKINNKAWIIKCNELGIKFK